MEQDGGLSFKTHLKSDFLLPDTGSKKCLEKSMDWHVILRHKVKNRMSMGIKLTSFCENWFVHVRNRAIY